MECAHTVAVYDQVSDLVTVREPRRGAIVSRGQNASISHNHGANMGAVTGATFCYGECNFSEVVVPRRTLPFGYWRVCQVAYPLCMESLIGSRPIVMSL
jgi:hypothetical protein